MRTVLFALVLATSLSGAVTIAAQTQNATGQQQSTTLPTSSAAANAAPAEPAPPSLDGALELLRTGKYSAATDMYNVLLLAGGSQAAPAYAGLARVYLKLGKFSEANAAATKAVETFPNFADGHVALGEVYFRQGKLTDAEHEFIALVRDGTANARGYLGMARVSASNSYYAQAKQMIDRAYMLDPNDPEVTDERFRIYSSQGVFRVGTLIHVSESASEGGEPHKVESAVIGPFTAADPSKRPCRMISHTDSMQTALTQVLAGPTDIRGYGLNVKLNGTTVNLLLDTGASGILLDRKVAEKAKIKKITDTKIGGIGDQGEAAGYTGVADSVKIGDLEFQECYVDVIDRTSVVGDDGLIGADMFAQFLVELDFPNQKFRLLELPERPEQTGTAASGSGPAGEQIFLNRYVAAEMKSFTPVHRFGHDLLVTTQVNKGAPRLFLLDTGSTMNTISPAAAKDVTKVSVNKSVQVKGVNGAVKNIFSGDDVTFTFGNLSQRNLDVIAFDTGSLSNSLGTEVSGILGFSMLRMLDIKIDYRDGLVQFGFDAKRWR